MLRIYDNHLFRTKLQNKDKRFYLLLKGRRQKCEPVVRIWMKSFRFLFLGIRFSEAGAHTIFEMFGINHLWVRWQVPFSKNPFLPFSYFWRQPYTSKGQNAASRCDSSVAFTLKQFELFQTTCDRPEAVLFIPDYSVVLKLGLKKLSDHAVYKIFVGNIQNDYWTGWVNKKK